MDFRGKAKFDANMSAIATPGTIENLRTSPRGTQEEMTPRGVKGFPLKRASSFANIKISPMDRLGSPRRDEFGLGDDIANLQTDRQLIRSNENGSEYSKQTNPYDRAERSYRGY